MTVTLSHQWGFTLFQSWYGD